MLRVSGPGPERLGAEADDMVAAIGVLMCGPTETLTIPMETMARVSGDQVAPKRTTGRIGSELWRSFVPECGSET